MHRPAKRRALRAALVFLLMAGFTLKCSAQKQESFEVSRERALGFDMRLSTIGPFHSSPYTSKFGLVWSRVVIHPSIVTSIRVHVQIAQAESRVAWHLLFKDLEGTQIEKIDSKSVLVRAGDFWSEEIHGRGARVEIWADDDPTGLDVIVDQYAYRTDVIFPQSIFGKDDRLPIGSAPRTVQGWSGPVARLRFMVSGAGQGLCTGFLVADDWLLTNEHCLRTPSELLSAVVEFGFESYASSPDRFRVDGFVVPPNTGLDYSLVRLAGRPGAKYGKVTLARTENLSEGQALVIIQHPAGEPKQVSIEDCVVAGAHRPGRGEASTDFGHHCDTLGGSSGSPIFEFGTGTVVGLHHLGFIEGSLDPVNQGIYVSLILRDLQTRYPDIYRALNQPSP